MTQRLPIGLIGCGRAGEHLYLPALTRSREFELAAVADSSHERCRFVATQVDQQRVFADDRQLLERPEIVGVVIATPPETHVPLTTDALLAGKHVLVEKPLADSREAAEPLLDLSPELQQRVMLGFNRRHWVQVQRLRSWLGSAASRGPMALKLIFVTKAGKWNPVTRPSELLLDLGSHSLDLVRYLTDREIATVRAAQQSSSVVQLNLRVDGWKSVSCTVGHGTKAMESMTVVHPAGNRRATVGSEYLRPSEGFLRFGRDAWSALYRRTRGRRSSFHDSYDHQLSRFAECIRGDTLPSPGLHDGWAAQCALEAARCSLRECGEEVAVR
jgi:predicted dehydrogenase